MDPYIYRSIRFILLLVFLIPSFICYLLVFFFIYKTQQITSKHLHHHFIVALLFCNFILIITELPIGLAYSYDGNAPVQSDRFCAFWVAYNYGLYDVGLFLMAFGSIERYFLIFHERLVHRWRRFIHYPGLIFCFVYPLMFYNMMVHFYPCEDAYSYDAYVCGGDCFQFQHIPGTADYLTNVFTPAVLTIVANMILLVRVIKQKRSMKIANTWYKNHLMYIQLVSISILYFLIWIPFVIVSLIRLFHDPLFLQDVTLLLLNYCLYICPLASPFISLIGLPAVRQGLKNLMSNMIGVAQGTDNRVQAIETVTIQSKQIQIESRQQDDEHPF